MPRLPARLAPQQPQMGRADSVFFPLIPYLNCICSSRMALNRFALL